MVQHLRAYFILRDGFKKQLLGGGVKAVEILKLTNGMNSGGLAFLADIANIMSCNNTKDGSAYYLNAC